MTYMLCVISLLENRDLPMKREHPSNVSETIEGEYLPPQVSYSDKLQSGQEPGED